MAKSREISMNLPSVDDLFTTQEERDQKNQEYVKDISIYEITDFPNHPFKVKEDEAMARLIESIERYGIMNPLIVMPTTEGFYRIISGHRRKYCAEKLGYTKVPAIIRYMKEDDSIISMVNSNLHKEKIRSRFGYSSTMDTRFCFVYQLSQKMMI